MEATSGVESAAEEMVPVRQVARGGRLLRAWFVLAAVVVQLAWLGAVAYLIVRFV